MKHQITSDICFMVSCCVKVYGLSETSTANKVRFDQVMNHTAKILIPFFYAMFYHCPRYKDRFFYICVEYILKPYISSCIIIWPLIVLSFSGGHVEMHGSKTVPQRKNKVKTKSWINVFKERRKFVCVKMMVFEPSLWLMKIPLTKN